MSNKNFDWADEAIEKMVKDIKNNYKYAKVVGFDMSDNTITFQFDDLPKAYIGQIGSVRLVREESDKPIIAPSTKP
jgi:hypothetical protein